MNIVSLINGHEGLTLDAHKPDVRRNGCWVQLYQSNTQAQQIWEIEKVDEDWSTISCSASGLCLDAHFPDAGKNGCRVQLWQKHAGANQLWRFIYVKKGWVLIQNKMHGLFIDAHAPDAGKNGCPIQLWENSKGRNQHWLAVVGKNLKQELTSAQNGGSLKLVMSTSSKKSNQAKIVQKDPDLFNPTATTGGNLGIAAGALVATLLGGPAAAHEGAILGGILGHSTDRILTRTANDITGPAWRGLEKSDIGRELGNLGKSLSDLNPF